MGDTGDADEQDDDLASVDLFGSDDEDDDPAPQDNDDELDEAALFGSDDDEAQQRKDGETPGDGDGQPPSRQSRQSGQSKQASEMTSEFDARDIFGDMSDEEADKIEDIVVRRRPEPEMNRVWRGVRLSNALSIEKVPFDPENQSLSQLVGFKTSKDARGRPVSQLIGPGNAIRWRRRRDSEGKTMSAEDGRPLYESNSRIVEWEDGSKTLHIGSEVFMLTEETKGDRGVLFEENSGDIHVCHGTVDRSFKATPVSCDSSTHQLLKTSQYSKFEPTMRTLLVSQEETRRAAEALELEKEMEEKQRRRERKRPSQEGELSAAFLEDDDINGDGGLGGSVLAIKKMAKRTS